MNVCDLAPRHIRTLAPYQPGKPINELARELGVRRVIKLASNENPLGCSPLAQEAIQRAMSDIARYPDANGHLLKAEIARRMNTDIPNLILGNGSNDLLDLAARTFLGPGTSAVYSQYAFSVYSLIVRAVGAAGIEVPAREYGHDLAAMRAAIRPDTRVVFITNPNNPTGTFLPERELRLFLDRVPAGVLVVLDEAYIEYVPAEAGMHAPAWIERYPNLLVARTFSKAYGLAGLRVGYGVAAAPVIDLMNRVRQPFNVGVPAQAAAIAALRDLDFLRRSCETNRAGLAQIYEGLRQMNLGFIPSCANFVLIRVGDGRAVYERLLRQGIIARPVDNYGLPEWLRVTVGLETENVRFLDALATSVR